MTLLSLVIKPKSTKVAVAIAAPTVFDTLYLSHIFATEGIGV